MSEAIGMARLGREPVFKNWKDDQRQTRLLENFFRPPTHPLSRGGWPNALSDWAACKLHLRVSLFTSSIPIRRMIFQTMMWPASAKSRRFYYPEINNYLLSRTRNKRQDCGY